mgnify:CR=1 FL=1
MRVCDQPLPLPAPSINWIGIIAVGVLAVLTVMSWGDHRMSDVPYVTLPMLMWAAAIAGAALVADLLWNIVSAMRPAGLSPWTARLVGGAMAFVMALALVGPVDVAADAAPPQWQAFPVNRQEITTVRS